MEEKRSYCNFYNCWCDEVDTNLSEIDIGDTECNYRCKKCSYLEKKTVEETFYTD